MYCWKNEINIGIYSKNETSDICFFPDYLPEYKKYEYKMTTGNNKYETDGFALKKKRTNKEL